MYYMWSILQPFDDTLEMACFQQYWNSNDWLQAPNFIAYHLIFSSTPIHKWQQTKHIRILQSRHLSDSFSIHPHSPMILSLNLLWLDNLSIPPSISMTLPGQQSASFPVNLPFLGSLTLCHLKVAPPTFFSRVALCKAGLATFFPKRPYPWPVMLPISQLCVVP